jgi:hypothetical protein
VFDRTVIAVPVLKEMQEDLDLIAKVEKPYPTVFQKFNSAIRVQQEFSGRREIRAGGSPQDG